MAANFWTSSHCKRLLEQEEISVVSSDDHDRGLTLEDVKIIKIYFSSYIKKLAQRAKVRQRVVATAIAYFRRVYTRKSFSGYDPRLVAPTCLYLASKAEESTVQAKLLIFYMKQIGSDDNNGLRYDIKDILEMEMKLLEALDYYLVIYHPYRPLVQLLRDAGLSDMIEMCWSILNDSYGTDLILMYPPYMIALACIYISCVINERDNRVWFEESRVDMAVIKNIAMQIFDFYDNYRLGFDDRVGAILLKISSKPHQ